MDALARSSDYFHVNYLSLEFLAYLSFPVCYIHFWGLGTFYLMVCEGIGLLGAKAFIYFF